MIFKLKWGFELKKQDWNALLLNPEDEGLNEKTKDPALANMTIGRLALFGFKDRDFTSNQHR